MTSQKYDVVLACGGLGTRLREITNNTPKPLYFIEGKSTLERCIEQLDFYQFKNVVISIGYKSNNFIEHIVELNKKY